MREDGMPRFDECEKVYRVSRGRGWEAAVALALAVGIAYSAHTNAAELDIMIWAMWAGAGLALIFAIAVGLAGAHNRVGVASEGLLIRAWPRRARFIRWAEIVALQEMSGTESLTGAAYGRRLDIRVRSAGGDERLVRVLETGAATGEAIERDFDAIRDTALARAGLRDTGDLTERRETVLRSIGGPRRTAVVNWTVRIWYRPGKDTVAPGADEMRASEEQTTANWYRPGKDTVAPRTDEVRVREAQTTGTWYRPGKDTVAPAPGAGGAPTLYDCSHIYPAGAGRGEFGRLAFPVAMLLLVGFAVLTIHYSLDPTRRPVLLLMPLTAALIALAGIYPVLRETRVRGTKIGACDAGIVIDYGGGRSDFFSWADVAGLAAETRPAAIALLGTHRTLTLYVGDPAEADTMGRVPLMHMRPGAGPRGLQRLTELRERVCAAADLQYSERLSSIDMTTLTSTSTAGVVTWIRDA
ncbi:MAG TPA: hypothetical protein DGT21_10420 [Armatimonadetes bacterium]|jgi:hypothetical protein|nr:hypothetical protein [Armatimonadota bacterium]